MLSAHYRICTLALLLSLLLGIPGTGFGYGSAYAQQPAPLPGTSRPYQILLQSREFTPPADITSEVRASLHSRGAAALSRGVDDIHVILQLDHIPTDRDKQALAKEGVKLLTYVPNYAWLAAIPASVPDTATNAARVRWMGLLSEKDKLDLPLRERQYLPWAHDPATGQIMVVVQFYDDVVAERAAHVVADHGGVVRSHVPSIHALVVAIDQEELGSLASEDIVAWMEQPLPVLSPINDDNRANVGADTLQAAPYNLDGSGVDVLVYDGGRVFAHDDLDDKRTWGDTAPFSEHATHVACTLCGEGTRNADLRGMAPAADLLSMGFEYDGTGTFLYTNPGDIHDDLDFAKNSWAPSADLLNASIGTNVAPNGFDCALEGNYHVTSQLVDDIVRGDLGEPFIAAWATGNERGNGACGTQYHTTAPPACAKNPIHSGATNPANDAMSDFSSWGPCDDGRLKPTISSAGVNVLSCDDSNDYVTMNGTSMASPTTAGIIALMLQQYRDTYSTSGEFLPSTAKALLIHTAHDLGNIGPDYQFGYGRTDGQAAVQAIRNRHWREATISSQGERDEYPVRVVQGAPELKVSLAWDDPGAAPLSAVQLVNDLDLELVAPNGAVFRPWILDPAHPGNPAATGTDALNNQEQVTVSGPMAGTWTIRVSGTIVPNAPQAYSLVFPAFSILEPTGSTVAYAGTYDSPTKIVVRTNKPADGLSKDDFSITIGGRSAAIQTVYEASAEYVLEVVPPSQPANGSFDLAITVGSGGPADMRPDAVRYADENHADVALVIDRSGSMGTYDYMEPAKDAAKQFVDFMDDGDMVGVVSFSSDATVNSQMTTITSTSRDDVKTTIDAISSSGNTSIGAGLQYGQDQLATMGDPAHPWAMVCLSDGYENTSPYVADVLPSIESTKSIIHSISLGPNSDEALLMDMAAQTGGTYSMAPSPEQLSAIYNTIAGAVTNRQTLFQQTGTVQQGVTDEKSVAVDSTVSEATFSVSWSSSANDLDLTLRKPDGNLIDPSVAASDPDVDYVSGSTYEYYRVKSPTLVSGVWTMNVSGGSIVTSRNGVISTAGGEPYTAIVTGRAALTMHSYFDKPGYLTTEQIKVSVTLADSQPILGADVEVSVQSPLATAAQIRASEWIETNGDSIPDPDTVAQIEAMSVAVASTIVLRDDGAHGDGQPDDGVYANTLPGLDTTTAGAYVFNVDCSGNSSAGDAFARHTTSTIYIAQNPHPSYGDNAVFLPMIAKNFGTTYFDDFSTTTSGWPVETWDSATFAYVNGEYRMLVKSAGYYWYVYAPGVRATDFTMETDVRFASSTDGHVGLVFCVTNDWEEGFYQFRLTSYGRYSIERCWLDGSYLESQTLKDWTTASSYHPYPSSNHMTIVRSGSNIRAYLNGTYLTTVTDSSYIDSRRVGIITGAPWDPNVDARFDNFTVEGIDLSDASMADNATTRASIEEDGHILTVLQ